MAVFNIGDQFVNGFFIIETPTTPNNNTGAYRVSNTLGIQYYVSGTILAGYDRVGNANSGLSSTTMASTSGSTTVVYSSSPVGAPSFTIPAGTAIGATVVVSTVPGAVIRLNNLSDQGQPSLVVGYDNPSTTSGRVIFAQSLAPQQIVDIEIKTYYGITVAVLNAPINSDFGINVQNNTGSQASVTGYDFTPIPPGQSSSVVVHAGACVVVRVINNSANNQSATLVGYDNASTTSGRILFRQQLESGESVKIGETAYFGITVAVVNGPTNSDFGVNVLYASSTSS